MTSDLKGELASLKIDRGRKGASPWRWPLLLLVPVLLVMRWGVIAREERYLEGNFGEPYRTYLTRVRRWL